MNILIMFNVDFVFFHSVFNVSVLVPKDDYGNQIFNAFKFFLMEVLW